MRLKEKISIITGAGSGIGRATAERFVAEGAVVVLVDINQEAIKSLAYELNSVNQREMAYPIQCDVSKADEVKQMVEETIHKFSKIDILFNNAGIEFKGKLADINENDWQRVMNVNLNSVFYCSKQVLPVMEKQKYGVIINTASQLGIVGSPKWGAYNATKAGIINLTRNMAIDYAASNIRVNAIGPGPIDTALTKRLEENLSEEEREEFYKDIYARVPMKRLGKAEEIASCVLFLASDEASYVTGAHLVVDGGYTAI
jgi:NAD(P)-dependent dehydrogenase (short-subunit alcohol dehydrogenase family)